MGTSPGDVLERLGPQLGPDDLDRLTRLAAQDTGIFVIEVLDLFGRGRIHLAAAEERVLRGMLEDDHDHH